MDQWNTYDSVVVLLGIIFFFAGKTSFISVVKMFRILKVGDLLKTIGKHRLVKDIKFELWTKVIDLFTVTLQIIPIIARFLNLFVFFYYLYAIIGMEIFYNFYDTLGSPAYNQYEQFGNFKTLIHAQYVNIQILFEGGWSTLCNNLVFKAPQYYGYIYFYFIVAHITYVYLIAYVVKGVFWEVYFVVHNIKTERSAEIEAET